MRTCLNFLILFSIYLSVLGVSGCSSDEEQKNPVDEIASIEWVRDPNNPVISVLPPTITNICDPTVVLDNDKFRLWAGCVGSDLTRASICYSESTDGTNWSDPIIVFSPNEDSNTWDNQKVEVPTVIKDEEETDPSKRYKMWYGGSNSAEPDLTKLGLAFSSDGLKWTRLESALSIDGKAGLVLEPGFDIGDAGVISDPTVVKQNGVYHVWYNSFGAVNDILISHSTSNSGFEWTKSPENPVLVPDQTWENGGPGDITEDVSHPVVIFDTVSGDFVLWYGSFNDTDFEVYSGLGFARSKDGITWTKEPSNPIFTPDTSKPGEEIGISTGPSVVFVAGDYHLFYCSANSSGVRVISHAISE